MTPRVSKPEALLKLQGVVPGLYEMLRSEFQVPTTFEFTLKDVDSITEEQLADPLEVAVFTMRKLQALYLLSQKGVGTTSDIVGGLCRDVIRSLGQLSSRCGEEAYETLQEAFPHLVGCHRVVTSLVPGQVIVELH